MPKAGAVLDLDAPVRKELCTGATKLASAALALYGAEGQRVSDDAAPDDPIFHLHVHVVPQFPNDHFVMTRAQ